jgi:hypothetical protein
MPKPAWYLTTSPEPEPDPALGALLADLTGRLTTTPNDLATALHIAVTASSHAGDALVAGHLPTDHETLQRLLGAYNRIAAQVTQTVRRLAYHADRRHLPGLADTPDHVLAEVTTSLAHAGVYAELVAGHLREAELTLTKHQLATPTT